MIHQNTATAPNPVRPLAIAAAIAVAAAAVVLPPAAAPHPVAAVQSPVGLTAADAAVLPGDLVAPAGTVPGLPELDLSALAATVPVLPELDLSALDLPALDAADLSQPFIDMSSIADELTQQAADPAAYLSLTFNPIQFLQGMMNFLWWPIQAIEHLLLNGVWSLL